MKTKSRLKKSFIITTAIFLIFLLVFLYFFKLHYSHNTELIEHYEKNKTLYSDYVKNFDSETDETREYDVPKELKAINVCRIESNGKYLFFDINDGGAYYGGIYYSADDSFAQETPIYGNTSEELYKTDFKEKRKGLFVKGEKNTGTDWYKSEKICNNWYYYEVHIA